MAKENYKSKLDNENKEKNHHQQRTNYEPGINEIENQQTPEARLK